MDFLDKKADTLEGQLLRKIGFNPFPTSEDLIVEPIDPSKSGDNISVTVRFRPLSGQRAWYADDKEKIVLWQFNPVTAYAFGLDLIQIECYGGKTHTMHGDHISPGVTPLAIKDVFSTIQDVVVADNYFTGSIDNLKKWIGYPRFELIRHDVTEPLSIEVDQIYHLACAASPIFYAVKVQCLQQGGPGYKNTIEGYREKVQIQAFSI
ncbi:hypothetical protein MKW98_018067 [Papaver atlanticum]|uniref:Uncharacterized protein n=1 Tax=Papaver atlanticum TaxID=357466 RepID=A0AAD4TFB1_9MAGN|nr:hypothetical protein MKW98_018067 [Papaver atlanticum]